MLRCIIIIIHITIITGIAVTGITITGPINGTTIIVTIITIITGGPVTAHHMQDYIMLFKV
jgi:hypothetical protein